jgi:hypothetical protein
MATLRRPLLGALKARRQLPFPSSRAIVERFVLATSSLARAALMRFKLGPIGPAARDLASAVPVALLPVTTTRTDPSTSRADNL